MRDLAYSSVMLSRATMPLIRTLSGLGGDFPRGHQVDYVLGHWNDEERKAMPERLKYFGDAILSFAAIGPERTMNLFNKK